ncbi:hypothetical protein [Corynebacterium sp.]|uniref:hypothetical protein n=1 Tax=Corynebacterium sp. TaxID=1720 RepID=UPI0026DAE37F|nr:hypothetical protein [Corynebacterium sp.]MDO5031289.1 hypothetical protein [Corynebacterium sp.]
MSKKGKRRGNRPNDVPQRPALGVLEALRKEESEYPAISFRHLQPGWGFEELTDKQRLAFLTKWHKRCRMPWVELSQQSRHGLGSEQLPRRVIKPHIPQQFTDVEKFHVYRHEGNHALVGWKSGHIFYVIWIEARFNDLYDHG